MKELTAKITKGTDVLIKSEGADSDLSSRLIAINWFDTKREWLYNLYNFLASRSVLQVGGKPLFKAKVIQDLEGSKGRRRILLIVTYPDGHAFKQLVESTYFKVVSLLRISSVDKFTFSFTQAISEPAFSSQAEDAHFCIHHFSSETDISEVVNEVNTTVQDLSIEYAGSSFAYLYRKNSGEDAEKVPSIVKNILIYRSDNKESMINYLKSDTYKGLFQEGAFGYAGILKKIF